MKIAHIMPIAHLELSNLGDFDFALAHIAQKSAKYRQFFSDQVAAGRTVFLDNGVWETGKPMNTASMITLAKKMNATYVYATDFIRDASKTLTAVAKFCRAAKADSQFTSKIIATAQGNNRNVWYECIHRLAQMEHVDVIAIPRHAISGMYEYEPNNALRMTKTRLDLCMILDRENIRGRYPDKIFTATGTGASLCTKELALFDWLWGIDTTMACLFASLDRRITGRWETFKPEEKLDFDQKLTAKQLKVLAFNIKLLNGWAHGEEIDE